MKNKEEGLLLEILNLLTDNFGKKAILRGGMVLRVLGSPRYTNDLDYVFVPYKSKKDIAPEIIQCLKQIEGVEVEHSFNSKCLRITVARASTKIQIEVKVAMEISTAVVTTKLIASDSPARLIPIVDHSIALANKLAAWNERRLVRDVYDICFFLEMNVSPDVNVLKQRLKKPIYSRLVKEKDYYTGSSLKEFYDFLRYRISFLSNKEIEEQMSDYLLPMEIVGLETFFKATLVKLKV